MARSRLMTFISRLPHRKHSPQCRPHHSPNPSRIGPGGQGKVRRAGRERNWQAATCGQPYRCEWRSHSKRADIPRSLIAEALALIGRLRIEAEPTFEPLWAKCEAGLERAASTT